MLGKVGDERRRGTHWYLATRGRTLPGAIWVPSGVKRGWGWGTGGTAFLSLPGGQSTLMGPAEASPMPDCGAVGVQGQ